LPKEINDFVVYAMKGRKMGHCRAVISVADRFR